MRGGGGGEGAGGDGDGGDGDGACRPSLFGGMRDRATRRATRATRRRGALSCQEESFWNYLYGFRESVEVGLDVVRDCAPRRSPKQRLPAHPPQICPLPRASPRAPRASTPRASRWTRARSCATRAPRATPPPRAEPRPPENPRVGSNHRAFDAPDSEPGGGPASHAATASGDAEAPVAPAAPPGDATAAPARERSRETGSPADADPGAPAEEAGDAPPTPRDAREDDARVVAAPPSKAAPADDPREPPSTSAPPASRASRDAHPEPPSASPPEASTSYAPGDAVAAPATFDENRLRLARVIETSVDRRDGSARYYVRFDDVNKRCDRWARADELRPAAEARKSARADADAALRSGGGDDGPREKGSSDAPRRDEGDRGDAGDGSDPHPSETPVGARQAPDDATDLGSPRSRSKEASLTRNQRRRIGDAEAPGAPSAPSLILGDDAAERDAGHDGASKAKNVETIEMGRFEMDCWYYSPFPIEFGGDGHSGAIAKMFVCERCLKYVRKRKTLARHKNACPLRHPPGDEIYRQPPGPDPAAEPGLSVFEVDGAKAGVYCQNLCLLSKLFLDHKTLYYDVDPFLFYVLCERSPLPRGRRRSTSSGTSARRSTRARYNLACILTLPPYQRKGYGRFLIALSYELSKREGRAGTPERPLSDLGQVSYRSYWSKTILAELWDSMRRSRTARAGGDAATSVADVSAETGIAHDDVVTTLRSHGMLRYYRGNYLVAVDKASLQDAAAAWCPEILEGDARDERATAANRRRGRVFVEYLNWTPDPDRAPKATTRRKGPPARFS